jgi:hypothetical protein
MRILPLVAVVVAAAGTASRVSAAEAVSTSLVVSAQFSSRTTLRVSTDLLRFDVGGPGEPATASVDFSAGARTHTGAEVVLSVEQLRSVDGPGGAADIESAISFAGEGAGTLDGALAASTPAIAGRWSGSGLRQGRLVFALRAGASGSYSVPVRFVLSAP